MDDRELAFRILRGFERTGSPIEPELDAAGDDDRAARFIRTIVSGVLRWRSLLDHIIVTLARRPVSDIDPDALLALRIGVYQVFYMNVPAHAAVSESVDLAAKHIPRARGFVNAILRKASTSDLQGFIPDGSDPRSVALRWSHPEWLIARWARQFGPDRAEAIARSNQELSHPDLLVNTAKIPVDEIKAQLKAEDRDVVRSLLDPAMLKLRGSTRDLAERIEQGFVYPMDEGSGVIARLIAEPGERILDLSAAPGGKSMAMALAGAGVSACDISLERILPLARIWRAFFGSTAPIVVADGSRPPFRRLFDRVLLDAPCSGTGILRKHPGIRWRLSEARIRGHAEAQARLLHSALDLAEDRCLYTTCSLEKEENDDVVLRVLRERDDFALMDLAGSASPEIAPWIQRSVLRLTPESGADGFTAIMVKRVRKPDARSVDIPRALP